MKKHRGTGAYPREFAMDRIVRYEYDRLGVLFYQVLRYGYPPEEDTKEPIKHLLGQRFFNITEILGLPRQPPYAIPQQVGNPWHVGTVSAQRKTRRRKIEEERKIHMDVT